MKRAIAACLALAGATFGAAHAGVPQTARAPITITDAKVLALPPSIVGDNGVSYGYTGVDVLGVSFVNTSAIAAREVTLRATYAGDTEYIHDAGTFAPGVTIAHNYTTFSNHTFRGAAIHVSVSSVRFSDGSTWTAPHTTPVKQS
jgi:hypothetical protein